MESQQGWWVAGQGRTKLTSHNDKFDDGQRGKRPLTVDFCKSRAKALLQTNVSSAIPCAWELNLAETAQNVTSSGANAADCKHRRKCLKVGEMFLRNWRRYLY